MTISLFLSSQPVNLSHSSTSFGVLFFTLPFVLFNLLLFVLLRELTSLFVCSLLQACKIRRPTAK